MLVTLGLSTVYALVRFPILAQTEYATVGAFLGLLFSALGLPLWISALAAAAVRAPARWFYRLIFARLLRVGPAIAMIGRCGRDDPARPRAGGRGDAVEAVHLPIQTPYLVGDAGVTGTQVAILALTAATVAAFFGIYRTGLGRAMRAVAAQPALARASGVDADRVVDVICFLGGAFAATGGILLAAGSQVHHNLGQDLLLPVFWPPSWGGWGARSEPSRARSSSPLSRPWSRTSTSAGRWGSRSPSSPSPTGPRPGSSSWCYPGDAAARLLFQASSRV